MFEITGGAIPGARFTRVDLSGAVFREVNLTGARIIGAELIDVDLDGLVIGLRVNGVDVGPLVEQELDRRQPERVAMRATDADGLRRAWHLLESGWEQTLAEASTHPEADLHRRIDDEWSLVETLRHLLFVTDAWFARAVLDRDEPYHPLGLGVWFLDELGLPLDEAAQPSLAEVLEARRARQAMVRDYLATATDESLAEPCHSSGAGYPPAAERTPLSCVRIVIDEEWEHRQFAIRDMAKW